MSEQQELDEMAAKIAAKAARMREGLGLHTTDTAPGAKAAPAVNVEALCAEALRMADDTDDSYYDKILRRLATALRTVDAARVEWHTRAKEFRLALIATREQRDKFWSQRDTLRATLAERDAELAAAREDTNRLGAAIRWALGETDFRERGTGEGAYWWRKELRARAGVLPKEASDANA